MKGQSSAVIFTVIVTAILAGLGYFVSKWIGFPPFVGAIIVIVIVIWALYRQGRKLLESSPEKYSPRPTVEEWLISFVAFFMENHDLDPVTSAYMSGVPYFDRQFMIELEELRSKMEMGTYNYPQMGIIAKNIFQIAANTVAKVYEECISQGKGSTEIEKAFREYAIGLLDGHEKALH